MEYRFLYYQSFIYSPTDTPVRCLKKTILRFTLKFTLKQLRRVSVLRLLKFLTTVTLVSTN